MADTDPINTKRMDDLELEAQGYQAAMPRQFSFWSLGALSFTLTCTWIGTGVSLGTGLAEASAAGALWALPVAGFMTFVLSLGMAELASAYPVAGAQYYWSFMVSSERHRAFAAFLNGWMSIIGWWLAMGSVTNFISAMILAIAGVMYPDFESHSWQLYLINVAIIWLCAAVNILGARFVPNFNKGIFLLSVATLSATIIALFVLARDHHAPASFIFADTQTTSGWPYGFAFVLAISNAVYGFLGTDCGAHLCEEIPNPSRNIPKVILYPILMGLATAFLFAVSLLYSITSLSAILSSTTFPLIDIYLQATGSKAGSSVLLAAIIVCAFGCLTAVGTTSSRTVWAVSRDGVFPYSRLWSRVHPTYQMPANAMILTSVCVTLYGLIFLGSTTAFAAMVNAAILFLQTSCVIPQGILIYRGRHVLPERYFSLGRWGAAVNTISVVWVVFLDVLYCFPVFLPVSRQNMSYVSVVCAGLVGFVIILWFAVKRGKFLGPNVDFDLMNRRRQQALHGQADQIADERASPADEPPTTAEKVGNSKLG